ncbi:MAG TPA: transglycosylase SLT domain-containing protein [Bacillota bacterium]|nr:transglycosylase SLT domain-containing protein [Bacillota bacterium]
MNPMGGVDDHTRFFPININQESKISNSGVENKSEVTGADSSAVPSAVPSGSHPDFQTPFKAILDNLMGAGADSPETGADITGLLTAEPGPNNNTSALFTALEQMSQPGLSYQDSDQTTDQQLNRFLSASKQVETQTGAQSVTDIPTTRVISNYQQAMREFQKAFNLLPAGNPIETSQNSPNMSAAYEPTAISNNSGLTSLGAPTRGVNPTQPQVTSYITEQCRQMGIPVQLGLATAATESGMLQFNKDGTPLKSGNPDSTDWGLMQINDRAWGDVYDFNLIKSDWKYNIRAGLQILKDSFDAALQNNEGSKGANNSLQNLIRAAYSGYNAGTGNIWRYRTPVNEAPQTSSYDVLNHEGYDLRDIRFWENYQKFS